MRYSCVFNGVIFSKNGSCGMGYGDSWNDGMERWRMRKPIKNYDY